MSNKVLITFQRSGEENMIVLRDLEKASWKAYIITRPLKDKHYFSKKKTEVRH